MSPRGSVPAGTTTLNQAVRIPLGLAPDAAFVAECVIQTANNYDLGAGGVMNGQIGVVTAARDDEVEVRLDGGESVRIRGDALIGLDFAYAVTAHKRQGSEYPAVVLPPYRSAGRLLNRAVLYTALTGASRLAVIVGAQDE